MLPLLYVWVPLSLHRPSTEDNRNFGYHSALLDFWKGANASVSLSTTWEAFKAFSRGSFQAIIRRVKIDQSADVAAAELRASTLETTYARVQDFLVYQSLQAALRDVLLRTEATKVHLLHQTQRIFEHGVKTGRLLAWLARE